jgi:hypothetical protein
MEKDWEALEKKWSQGIEPQKATNSDLQEYADLKLHEYNNTNIIDHDLWSRFCDDFIDFTVYDFERLSRRYLQKLRRHLRCGGVYILPADRANRNLGLVDTIYLVLERERHEEWTEEDIKDCVTDLSKGPITLQKLQQDPRVTRVLKDLKGSPLD